MIAQPQGNRIARDRVQKRKARDRYREEHADEA
jgi:hypothetical protein